MVVATSNPDPFRDGYPQSSAFDLDPGLDVSESLDDADRAASNEHRVAPEQQGQHGSTDDDPRDDVDDADAAHA